MLTLNQTIEILKNFSLKHKQLGKGINSNHFYFGDKWEVNDNDDLNYPLMWVSLLPTQYDKSGLVTNKFQIDISDKVNLDESNETHVLSDTQSICFDLLNYLEQVADSGEIGMLFGSTSELTDYTEDRDDMVSGWFFTTEIKTHLSSASCDLPIVNGSILDSNYIYAGNDIRMTTIRNIETFANFTGDTITLAHVPLFIFMIDSDGLVVGNYSQTNNIITLNNPLDLESTIRVVYEY